MNRGLARADSSAHGRPAASAALAFAAASRETLFGISNSDFAERNERVQ